MHRIRIVLSLIAVLGGVVGAGRGSLGTSAQEATPGAASSADTLVAFVVDAALLTVPSGEPVLGHIVDQPGWRQTIRFPTASASVVYVAAGAYTMRSDGPVVLLRATTEGTPAATEAIAPGRDVTAHAGETLVSLSSARTEERNDGTVPTDRYALVISGPGQPTIDGKVGTSEGELVAALSIAEWGTPPPGPVTVTMRHFASTAAAPTPLSGSKQLSGEVGGAVPGRVVVTFSPGALPGVILVDLATEGTPTA